jgi:hypothetical protein
MRSMIAVVVAASMLAAGCGGNTADSSDSSSELDGIWVLTSYVLDGVEHHVDADLHRQHGETVPWLKFADGVLSGFTGCNHVVWSNDSSWYRFDGETLTLDEVDLTAIGCEWETAEPAMMRALLIEGEDGLAVTIADDSLVWSGPTVNLTFERSAYSPPYPVSPDGTWVGALSCTGGRQVVQSPIEGTPGDPESLLLSVDDQIVDVYGADPAWWGNNANGIVIAGLLRSDNDPSLFVIAQCQ